MKLQVQRVCVSIGSTPILRDVNLDIASGEVVGLIGPNGSGKSTLLRTIYRSVRPTDGQVLLGDEDVWSLSARAAARRTAAVLQNSPTPPGLTVQEVAALGRTPHKGVFARETAEDHDIVVDALERTGMLGHADRIYGSLSGGEKQRVLLARALAQQPQLLVLDEPTNHLDIRARFELLELVHTLGVTTLAVLHDLDLAVRSCDRLVVLDRGKVVAVGPVLDALTPQVLSGVFGVTAETERHDDGVVRVTYGARPLARAG
ncbi:ABC transporter ATP-binding protein [Micromonospora peucetia]|uniref:ABC transporter ATP-binding protein n=1 Tax=Micromonospora peucetia TaxID=47871 RepID=A0A1C6U960_9ACTN|nr:ABC transporter ATP-binding protein [Micromonospora peucetia]MCX4386286.1 ABC transporter ATP-binding protein [Micromonospora peucetia]WSA33628.1 ABC transporter ATP-binding protein [Micromonospora peucetia]SCL50399.1 iron complex transport system ATP-binding protein [Micromonospora peucetia]